MDKYTILIPGEEKPKQQNKIKSKHYTLRRLWNKKTWNYTLQGHTAFLGEKKNTHTHRINIKTWSRKMKFKENEKNPLGT